MKTSFLSGWLQRFYPETTLKVQDVLASSVLLEKTAHAVYTKLDNYVQRYADVAARIKDVTRLLDAWRNKGYEGVSYSTLFICAFVMLYVVSPVDIVPEFIPFIGGLDDILLIGWMLKTIDSELVKFRAWEQAQTV